MKRKSAFIGFILAVLTALGCGGSVIVVSGIEVYEKYWVKSVSQIESRASFELSCPANNLSFHLLEKTGRLPTQIGVDGCGQRAVYVRPVVRSGNGRAIGDWILNSSSR